MLSSAAVLNTSGRAGSNQYVKNIPLPTTRMSVLRVDSLALAQHILPKRFPCAPTAPRALLSGSGFSIQLEANETRTKEMTREDVQAQRSNVAQAGNFSCAFIFTWAPVHVDHMNE